MAHAGEKIRFRAVGLLRRGHRLLEFLLDLLADRVVGADQQIADESVMVVAQCRYRHNGRKPAAILADDGRLVDVFDPARSLESQSLEAGCNGGGEFAAQCLRACHHFLWVMHLAWADPVHDLGRAVAQQVLGTRIE